MRLFKKKPKIKKYLVKVTANQIRHCINDIPTKEEAIALMENILKARTKWVAFGSFFFLTKDVKHIQLDSYTEKVKK